MKGLAINNQMLHDVTMPMRQDYHNGMCSLGYPKSRILYDIKDNKISLKIPSCLALELYRNGCISQDPDALFPVSLSGVKIGMYRLDDLRYPDKGDNITITLVKA
ncbi:hypothetical protein [Endozoicomonas sp.]|uniref:hypothetical protein n=1 Tax=Endozoicomonas sp. TaxID=1892382 RepID=UPI002885E2F7|nr:hypothetical protein [Endozoicomonas sp.]